MKVIADAFGGDNAPLEIIKGCLDAQKAYGVEILLVGDTKKFKPAPQKTDWIFKTSSFYRLTTFSKWKPSRLKS